MCEAAKQFIGRQIDKLTEVRAEATQFVKELDAAKMYFYAAQPNNDPSFNFGPFYHFGDVKLFVYAGCKGTRQTFWNLLRRNNKRLPRSDQFVLPYRPLTFLRDEVAPSPIDQLFHQIPGLPLPEWAIMIRLSRQVAGATRTVWLLAISGDPLLELRRLCGSRGTAPNYLALCGLKGRVLHCS